MIKNNIGEFTCGGAFLNDPKSKRQVLFSYLHYGGLNPLVAKANVIGWTGSIRLAGATCSGRTGVKNLAGEDIKKYVLLLKGGLSGMEEYATTP